MRHWDLKVLSRAGVVFKQLLPLTIMGLAGLLLIYATPPRVVNAETPLSQAYKTNEKLVIGSIVSLENNSTDTVVAANIDNVGNLLGVVVGDESSFLRVKSAQAGSVQVATTGTLDVLVSDVNGPILRGDHITSSPINGVGMKATGNVKVIGIAQGDLEPNGVKQTYKDQDGKDQTVTLGQIASIVNVAYYFKEPDKTLIPSAIQKLADAVAGKTVNAVPILISVGIFVVMLIVVASIIYSMIRGSIISVGRNPMSQSAVYRNLIQLSALVLVILGVGFSAMYLVITRVG